MDEVYITATVKMAGRKPITQRLLVEVVRGMSEEEIEAEKQRVTEEWAHDMVEFFYEDV